MCNWVVLIVCVRASVPMCVYMAANLAEPNIIYDVTYIYYSLVKHQVSKLFVQWTRRRRWLHDDDDDDDDMTFLLLHRKCLIAYYFRF